MNNYSFQLFEFHPIDVTESSFVKSSVKNNIILREALWMRTA